MGLDTVSVPVYANGVDTEIELLADIWSMCDCELVSAWENGEILSLAEVNEAYDKAWNTATAAGLRHVGRRARRFLV